MSSNKFNMTALDIGKSNDPLGFDVWCRSSGLDGELVKLKIENQ
jgi:hypothetical protein